MPKHARNSSEPSYNGFQTGLAPPPMYHQPQQRMQMPANYYAVPSSSSSSSLQIPPPPPLPQHHHQQQHEQPYDPYDADATSPTLPGPPAHPHRPSSGAWTTEDDQQLVTARMQGLNWSNIKDAYFPNKTSNACRKRHERLVEKRSASEWDVIKMQRLAQEYMCMRKEIWAPLAAKTGEKWNVVEAKCMSNGLKNLQSAARAASRRDRLETGGASSSLTGYDDDSGVSGIGLTPVDELDASYSSPEAGSSGAQSLSSSASYHQHPHQHQHQQHHHQIPHQNQHLQPHAHLQPQHHHHQHQHHQQHQHHPSAYGVAAAYYDSHGYSSSVSSNASMNHAYVSRGPAGDSQGSSPYMDGQRLSGADMGIGSVVNRPGGGAV